MKKLTVLECPFRYSAWKAVSDHGREEYISAVNAYQGNTCMHEWHRRNVYAQYNGEKEFTALTGDCAETITENCALAVKKAMAEDSVFLMTGGYCNYAPAIAGGLQEGLKDKRIGVIWMDAHADCCIAEGKESMRFVAVPTSTMLGLTLPKYRENICHLHTPIPGNDFLASGVRIMDEETAQIYTDSHVIWLDQSAYESDRFEAEVQALSERTDVIYLSIDADILHPKYVPSYIKAVPFGCDPETVSRKAASVMKTGKVKAVSLFCFDFDLYQNDGEITEESGRKILESILQNWQ